MISHRETGLLLDRVDAREIVKSIQLLLADPSLLQQFRLNLAGINPWGFDDLVSELSQIEGELNV